ncbi:RsmB/NOP family class I SAM-dependent RNA methyltransferase [Methylobacterium sp. BTF04]|uniref:RsmB/NOP family class I SAM-dependent RNA methyltransferase n=1 Tax=Methylobacterium sp. BTF04 TaxID=2708300 RepID=UPI0013D86147|nr:RsmB/NOP family class I SAM-dependent RNA methyltransferase [Methylobacterium sp. BTF04]NEU11632.1 RsmB/NOP family class I SAM-dependent RNA methyltransferase [Methylobacterium sp. BTF04]
MTPPARLSAAIEVLADIAGRRRPAADALKDWGLAHRFAGSGDRAAIASLVYDTLRRRASAAWIMGDDSPRSLVIGMLRLQYGLAAPTVAGLFSGERFAPDPLTDHERTQIDRGSLTDAPAHVAGDVPDWVLPALAVTFGGDLLDELRALGRRAPLDIRVNTLKRSRDAALAGLEHLASAPTPHAPHGLRIPIGEDGRGPALHVEPEFIDGWYEIQDEGSQLASLLSGAKAGETVVDLCAGGGGKTLSLAAMMNNDGRLIASDDDPRRLAPIHERLRRAGAMAEIRTPRGGRARTDMLGDLDGTVDRVLVDAPCTGSGTWRRNPDAKWRMRPGSLSARVTEQATVLDRAALLVRPGGRVTYITCSLMPEENDAAVAGLLARTGGSFSVVDAAGNVAALAPDLAPALRFTEHGLQMSPALTGTDGFYVATLERRG